MRCPTCHKLPAMCACYGVTGFKRHQLPHTTIPTVAQLNSVLQDDTDRRRRVPVGEMAHPDRPRNRRRRIETGPPAVVPEGLC